MGYFPATLGSNTWESPLVLVLGIPLVLVQVPHWVLAEVLLWVKALALVHPLAQGRK